MLSIYSTQCCAVMEITDLSRCENAEKAMASLCSRMFNPVLSEVDDDDYETYGYWVSRRKLALKSNPKANVTYYDTHIKKASTPSGFYTFTGVIRGGKGDMTYGPKFASFIRRNNLGRVRSSVAAPNRKNHPDHIVKVWVWAPNPTNLKRWWEKHGKRIWEAEKSAMQAMSEDA